MEEKIICPKCGNEVIKKETTKFCRLCGCNLQNMGRVMAQPKPAPQPKPPKPPKTFQTWVYVPSLGTAFTAVPFFVRCVESFSRHHRRVILSVAELSGSPRKREVYRAESRRWCGMCGTTIV